VEELLTGFGDVDHYDSLPMAELFHEEFEVSFRTIVDVVASVDAASFCGQLDAKPR